MHIIETSTLANETDYHHIRRGIQNISFWLSNKYELESNPLKVVKVFASYLPTLCWCCHPIFKNGVESLLDFAKVSESVNHRIHSTNMFYAEIQWTKMSFSKGLHNVKLSDIFCRARSVVVFHEIRSLNNSSSSLSRSYDRMGWITAQIYELGFTLNSSRCNRIMLSCYAWLITETKPKVHVDINCSSKDMGVVKPQRCGNHFPRNSFKL